jgi:hypothetical protein
MAKNILYIDNGENIDVSWTGHIVISSDGVNWDGINKIGLSVGKHKLNLNTSAPNSFPERNKEDAWVVSVKRYEEDGPILKFNPAKVLNQTTWVSPGAATELAGAQKAVSDIMSWIA